MNEEKDNIPQYFGSIIFVFERGNVKFIFSQS